MGRLPGAALALVVALLSGIAHGFEDETGAVELLRDLSFLSPVKVEGRDSGQPTAISELHAPRANLSDPPTWRLAQWNSKHVVLVSPEMGRVSEEICWRNPAKAVCFVRAADGPAQVTLEIDAVEEYGGRFREAQQPWPMLLLAQQVSGEAQKPAGGARSLSFGLKFRILKAEPLQSRGYDSSLHALQFLATLIVQNVASGSPGKGQYIWVVLPLYDSRYKSLSSRWKLDSNKGKFLWIVDQREIVGTLADGVRTGVDYEVKSELLPSVRRALIAAMAKGHLVDSDFSNYKVTSFSIGFEAPGPGRLGAAVSSLHLRQR